MSPLFRQSRFLALLLFGGCTVPSPLPFHPLQPSYYRQPAMPPQTVPPKIEQPQNPIRQTAYVPELPPVDSSVQASTDLYQPWNLDEFAVRSNTTASPYRLVAGAESGKTPPPAANPNPPTTADVPQRQPVKPPLQIRQPLGYNIVREFQPSNHRKWSQNHAVLQTADFVNSDRVIVRNVRYSRYKSAEEYTTQYYDAEFNLDDVRTLDLIMVPFRGTPRLAHVESSFGFADGRQLAMSIEARYEEGEKYDPLGAGLRQFELIYVFADERDMIRLGTDVHNNNVYIYRLNFTPQEVRVMFVDALQRANRLAAKPEFYHPLANSCVTNLIVHINKGRPGAVPTEYRTIIPGLLDSYFYDLKLIAQPAASFKKTKEQVQVNWLVEKYGDLEYFSAGIRQNMH